MQKLKVLINKISSSKVNLNRRATQLARPQMSNRTIQYPKIRLLLNHSRLTEAQVKSQMMMLLTILVYMDQHQVKLLKANLPL